MNMLYTYLVLSFMGMGSLRAMDDNANATAAASDTGVGEEYVLVPEQSQQSLRNRRGVGHENDQQHNNQQQEWIVAKEGTRVEQKKRALALARAHWEAQKVDQAAVYILQAQDLGATEEELQWVYRSSADVVVQRTWQAVGTVVEGVVDGVQSMTAYVDSRFLSQRKKRKADSQAKHDE